MARLAMPFLDNVVESDEHGPERGALIRPWMSYWPPEAGSELHSMLQQSVPEVLTWRFNPSDPFDRRTLNGHGEVAELQKTCEEARRLSTEELDSKVAPLGLRHTIPSQLNYLDDDPIYLTTKPYNTRLPYMGKIPRSNIVAQGYSGIKIHDIRGHEEEFVVDESGFQYFKIRVDITNWTNETVKHQYLPLMETWLKDFFRAQRVHIFTYTFRCSDRGRTSTEEWAGPYMRAHCDITLNSGLRRLDLHLPEEAEEIKKGRWRIVGLWRALTGPNQDRPLALLHNGSLSQQDLVGEDVVFPHYCDEGYEVRYSPLHRWFYKSRMEPDEAILFKLYDSSADHVRFCPHGSFIDPSVPDDTPQRASIEIRAIIIG